LQAKNFLLFIIAVSLSRIISCSHAE